jgi:hypothetical protein
MPFAKWQNCQALIREADMSERCETCGQWLPADRPHKCGEPNPPAPTPWSPERVARLLELNAAGMSTADMAADLGGTKSMVAGKLFRELGPRPKPPLPPRPPKPPAPLPPAVHENIPATTTNPCVEITDPSTEELEISKTPKSPAAKRPPHLPRHVAGPRFAANGMLVRIKQKQTLPETTPPPAKRLSKPDVAPGAAPVTIDQLTGATCRWPLWGLEAVPSSERLYCGVETIVPGRYCANHTTVAYNKTRS